MRGSKILLATLLSLFVSKHLMGQHSQHNDEFNTSESEMHH